MPINCRWPTNYLERIHDEHEHTAAQVSKWYPSPHQDFATARSCNSRCWSGILRGTVYDDTSFANSMAFRLARGMPSCVYNSTGIPEPGTPKAWAVEMHPWITKILNL